MALLVRKREACFAVANGLVEAVEEPRRLLSLKTSARIDAGSSFKTEVSICDMVGRVAEKLGGATDRLARLLLSLEDAAAGVGDAICSSYLCID